MTRTVSAIVASAIALTLSGCMGAPAEGLGPQPLTPTQRYSLQVEPGVERIALAVHDTGLSANQDNALVDIANRFASEGAPVLTIEAPAGGDPVANAAAFGIKGRLESIGVPGHLVQVVSYPAPDPRAPVLVGFETLKAVVPQCGTRWGNLARTGNNNGFENFGCAVSANLAAQIANPRDIITPRQMTPADAARRSVVFDNYRKGVETSAPQEELISGQRVSQAVQ